jgi:hypothetical protein
MIEIFDVQFEGRTIISIYQKLISTSVNIF